MNKPGGTRRHLFLILLTCIPVYWGFLLYISLATRQETEELAVAASIGFYGCLYAGRYLQGMLARAAYRRIWQVGIGLTVLILFCLLWLFAYTHYRIQHHRIHLFFYSFPIGLMSVSLGMLIKLVRNYVEQQVNEARASAAQSEGELQLLQSQLSPHFLFNTLNNLYGLSITRHELIPPLLLKLSELLRYSVYEVKTLFVPLPDEIGYLINYMAFEKLRIGERLVLSENISVAKAKHKVLIAPMLLIVFIENAFKHARNTDDDSIRVDFNLQLESNYLYFQAVNSYQGLNAETAISKHSGIGLANVRKRLELLYSGKYELTTEGDGNQYHVRLKIQLT